MLDRARIDQIDLETGKTDTTLRVPDPDEVRAALERIVLSSEFRASPHLAAFLKFSVEKSLAGEGQNIKAYSVATGVLGRPPTFDPQADPIVRVEATRLRRAMERYYLHEGADDPICIDIPRGRYIAYFSYRDACISPHEPAATMATDDRDETRNIRRETGHKHAGIFLRAVWSNLSRSEQRSMTVFAFALMGAMVTWSLAPVLKATSQPVEQALLLQAVTPSNTMDASAALTGSTAGNEGASDRIMFAMLQLIPFAVKSERADVHDAAHRLISQIASRAREFDGIPVIDPDMPSVFVPSSLHLYALVGSVFEDRAKESQIDVSIRLVHQTSREIVWTRNFALDTNAMTSDEAFKDVTDNVVSSLTGLYGAIRVDDARRHHDSNQPSTPCQLCLARSDIALRTEDAEKIREAISCLSALIDKKPNEALLYKQLAALRIAAGHHGEAQSPDLRMKSLSLAVSDLETAIRLQPEDHFAQSALLQLQSTRISTP